MSSLKEIKNRINSVKSTLKITSAMKLVASSKLHKAQAAIETMLPYQKALQEAFSSLSAKGAKSSLTPATGEDVPRTKKTVVVAVASNSSLCGGFNANVARKCLDVISKCDEEVVFMGMGRKLTDIMRRSSVLSVRDFSSVVAHPAYDDAAALSAELVNGYLSGEFSKVILVYTHFVSTARQELKVEEYLPFEEDASAAGDAEMAEDYIVEPSAQEIITVLLPKVLSLKLYAMLLDSAAAEHAARTVAMQVATDNGNEILADLTVEYNKGRQNKITSEILDLVGGMVKNS